MDAPLRDRAVLLGDTLVCADLHVGKGRSSNVQVPLGERDHLVERLAALCDRYDPAEVVFAGDLLHSFDRVPSLAEDTVTALARTCRDAGARAVVTPGNHDTMLDVVWDGPTEHEYVVDGVEWVPGAGSTNDERGDGGPVVVCHGHGEPGTDAALYVVGHDHPTITIEGQKWHCYLYGENAFRGADVLMLPAFTKLVKGVSINRRYGTAALNSPLVTDLDRFRPIVWDESVEETRRFPPLGEFRELL
ncbi:metallophosphoesterase [Halorientalis salina]|uniref:metallophosphoesterase n=1 Tax=Halorientalis salina TaxID=2932266 RepID=UPI0010AC5303|nr:metallophosphoesterase [Halorientalis salina]